MSMNAEQIVDLMNSELKRTEELLERLKNQKEHRDLALQTEGQYIILKQMLGVIDLEKDTVVELISDATQRSKEQGIGNGKTDIEFEKE